MSDAKIIDRIRKVLALANGTDNAAEAELMMAKVSAMLEEHNLSMLDLDTLESDDPVGYDANAITALVNDKWYINLAFQVARYYGCDGYKMQLTKNKTGLTIVGRESNRVTALLMMPYIKQQVMAEGRRLVHEAPWDYRNSRIASRRVANALIIRISRLVAEKKRQEEQRVSSGSRALVPVDAIDAIMKAHNVRPGRATSRATDRRAAEAAEGISLYRQTGGGAQKALAAE